MGVLVGGDPASDEPPVPDPPRAGERVGVPLKQFADSSETKQIHCRA